MKLIIGLGNPGKDYEGTYHNMGFEVLYALCERLGVKAKNKECKALTVLVSKKGEKTVLAFPQTFMNLSGESVRELCAKYQASPQDTLIVYDDIDLPAGTLRFRKEGSAGTHNGMRNIIALTGSERFLRLRVGIGKDSNIPLIEYVLSRPAKENKDKLAESIARAADALYDYTLSGDFEKIMREYNG